MEQNVPASSLKPPPPPPGRQSSGPKPSTPRLHPRTPSGEPPLTPSRSRSLSSAKLAVAPPSPSGHRRAQSADLFTEICDIPTPTTRTRSGFAARPPKPGAAQSSLSALSPHSRAKQRWSSAARASVTASSAKTFADIVLESRRIRPSPKSMDGGFRELVVLLAAIKRNKGVSAEQSYKLKSMMLSRDPEEFQRAKDFLEKLDQYTQQNNADSAHTQYPHMNELDDVSKIIHTPEGYHSFFSFLQSEYSQENLLFWRAVKDFERAFASDKPSDEIKEHAMRLWNSYIGPQSENTINLSSDTVKGFKDQLFSKSGFSTDLLLQACEAAKSDIEQLLARDSFQRYKRSPLYTKLGEDAQAYHNSPQKREKRRGGSDLIREFFGKGESA